MRKHDIRFSNGWSMYFWFGLSWKWVLCDGDGCKIAMNDELDPNQNKTAIEWAEKIMESFHESGREEIKKKQA